MTTTDAPAGLAAPGADGLLQRIEDLHDLIAKNAAQGEADRRVPQDTVDALMAAGAFKLAVPKRYGGYETSLRTLLEISAAVAEADGGTSWVVTVINGSAWLAGLFPGRAQDEVFGTDPEARVSGVISPTAEGTRKVDGGWRVTGKWFYNSGSWHAYLGRAGHPGHRCRRRPWLRTRAPP